MVVELIVECMVELVELPVELLDELLDSGETEWNWLLLFSGCSFCSNIRLQNFTVFGLGSSCSMVSSRFLPACSVGSATRCSTARCSATAFWLVEIIVSLLSWPPFLIWLRLLTEWRLPFSSDARCGCDWCCGWFTVHLLVATFESVVRPNGVAYSFVLWFMFDIWLFKFAKLVEWFRCEFRCEFSWELNWQWVLSCALGWEVLDAHCSVRLLAWWLTLASVRANGDFDLLSVLSEPFDKLVAVVWFNLLIICCCLLHFRCRSADDFICLSDSSAERKRFALKPHLPSTRSEDNG